MSPVVVMLTVKRALYKLYFKTKFPLKFKLKLHLFNKIYFKIIQMANGGSVSAKSDHHQDLKLRNRAGGRYGVVIDKLQSNTILDYFQLLNLRRRQAKTVSR